MKRPQFSCTLYFYAMAMLRCRAALGWTFRGSAYCQLIRQQNEVKCLQWAQERLSEGGVNCSSSIYSATNRFVVVLVSDE